MNDFTASNGIHVLRGASGQIKATAPDGLMTTAVGYFYTDAVREFFQSERDAELGRWRWPDNPDFVVHAWTADPPRRARGVTVLSESIPRGYTVWEDNVDVLYGTSTDEDSRGMARKAARAYFAAHPEPKPWHDVKRGEVWVLTVSEFNGRTDAFVVDERVEGNGKNLVFEAIAPDYPISYLGLRATVITAGHRIYPEGDTE